MTTCAAMDPSTWTARKTSDNKVAVIDVIAHVRNVTHNHAALIYTRLRDEDRVPTCTTQALPPRVDYNTETNCTHTGTICPQLTDNTSKTKTGSQYVQRKLCLRGLILV